MAVALRGTEKRKKDEFFSGVLILSLSAIIVKVIGLIYKIPMLGLLGSEGMGYFNSAYEVYTFFCSIATTGLPVAMAVMISSKNGEESESRRIFRVSLGAFLVFGGIGCLTMIAFARPFAEFLGSDKALRCMLAIAPTVLLICISGAYRGFFQGKGRMLPTALSQVIEALGKLILGLLLALIALNFGADTPTVAAMAALGLTLGVGVSVLYLASAAAFEKKKITCDTGEISQEKILPTLLKTAIPVTLSSSVVSITKVIDMSMILRRLQDLGQSSEQAFSAYGSYTTLALPLFSLSPALVTAIAMPLIPSLSSAVSSGDIEGQKKVATDALRLTVLISAPASLGLVLFSKPILELIFSGEDAAIALAAPLLACLGLSVTLSCLITVENAILQSYGKAHISLMAMAVGSAIKMAVAYFLIGNPSVGLMGAPISTFVCDLTINAVNFYFIGREIGGVPIISRVLLRPYLSAAVAVCISRFSYNVMCLRLGESRLITVFSVALAASLYFLLARLSDAVEREDVLRISGKPLIKKGQ